MSETEDGPKADLIAHGRAVLQAQPFSRLLGTILEELRHGHAVLCLPISEELKQQHGFVHGGVVSYLADNAITFAGGTQLGVAAVTSEMKINYLRPAVGQLLIARARAIGTGRTQAVVRCDVLLVVDDSVERLCAAAQGTIVGLAVGANSQN